jgi:pimeloyl-ACP methyl ester carboxylesterase
LKNIVELNIPTLMIQGGSGFCDLPSALEGQKKYFLNGYERIVLDGVGHFPHREAPAAVAEAVLRLLRSINS